MSNITLKGIIDEDFVNYRVPSMTLMFPKCSFKCEKEYGERFCQNSSLVKEPNVTVSLESIYNRYVNNPITEAIVLQGLEPMDSFGDVIALLYYFRYFKKCKDDIVIYTGYKKDEIPKVIEEINRNYQNIIIKFGRYVPNQEPHYDEVLGVNLASDNQYAEKIS